MANPVFYYPDTLILLDGGVESGVLMRSCNCLANPWSLWGGVCTEHITWRGAGLSPIPGKDGTVVIAVFYASDRQLPCLLQVNTVDFPVNAFKCGHLAAVINTYLGFDVRFQFAVHCHHQLCIFAFPGSKIGHFMRIGG